MISIQASIIAVGGAIVTAAWLHLKGANFAEWIVGYIIETAAIVLMAALLSQVFK